MEKQDSFKEFDFEGEENLRAIAEADKFNEWMYHQVKPHCEGKILEIGSGIGNISFFFDRDGKDVDLSDIREQYRSYLKKTFEKRNVLDIDIVAGGFIEIHGDILGTYDAVFALNVVEHIKDDKLAIENMLKLLKPGGKIVILVPAYQWLYNGFDVALEHYKRYTKSRLLSIFPLQGATFVKSWYFNFAGIFGWFLVGSVLKKKLIPESNMKLYNILTPMFKIADKLVMNKMGLSVIAVYQKD